MIPKELLSSPQGYFSVAILWILIFCILGFSKCNTYIIAENIMLNDYVEMFLYSYMEVLNWKENKNVGSICFEVRIPMKKTKIFMESFYVSLKKDTFIQWLENKNIYGNISYSFKWPVSNRAKVVYYFKHFNTLCVWNEICKILTRFSLIDDDDAVVSESHFNAPKSIIHEGGRH